MPLARMGTARNSKVRSAPWRPWRASARVRGAVAHADTNCRTRRGPGAGSVVTGGRDCDASVAPIIVRPATFIARTMPSLWTRITHTGIDLISGAAGVPSRGESLVPRRDAPELRPAAEFTQARAVARARVAATPAAGRRRWTPARALGDHRDGRRDPRAAATGGRGDRVQAVVLVQDDQIGADGAVRSPGAVDQR